MSSDSEDENIIRYGTPLEPYEEDEIPSKRKYQQPADQYAVDEHGRRRFHGAFTGGFSAGFGNTVGSQEGWTPMAYHSSRSEKAKHSNQRPEDFMDEEDRSEHGIAPRLVQTHSDFSGQKRPRPRGFHDGPIPGEPVLSELLRPVHETAAVKILKAMGWRPGQGTGERLTKQHKKKAQEQQKVYGCYVPPELRQKSQSGSDHSDSSDSEVDFDTLFAPDDYDPYILNRKDERFGLGYKGLSRHSVLGNLVGEYGNEPGSSRSHLVMKEKGKKVSIRGQAFGVGAFENDDEDIYATEDMSHYDFTLGGPTNEKQKPKVKKDGLGQVLEGFVRSTKPLPSVPTYPAPALPRDYTPAPAGPRRTRFEQTHIKPRDQGLGRHELTADARGALLGETPLPKQTPPESNKQTNIQTLLTRTIDFSSSKTTESDKIIPKTIPIIDLSTPQESSDFISIKDSGKEIKNVFRPFALNPLKQKRYEQFLESGVLERDGDVDRLSEWEREREMAEFEQAAKLYKPLSGIMGDRFTHASQPDDALNPLTAVAKSSINYGSATAEQIEAAKKGLYGVMTRSKSEWRPETIVCKRFNVPEPGVTRYEPKKDEKPKVSYSIFSYLESSVHDKNSFAQEQTKFSGSKSLTRESTSKTNIEKTTHNTETTQNNTKIPENVKEKSPITQENNEFKRMTVAELFLKESEKKKEQGAEVTETINQFDKMDLYQSIFLTDSEDEAETELLENSENIGSTDYVEKPKNVLRNTSPPRGIFADIDFDELNSWRRTDKQENTDLDNRNLNTEKSAESLNNLKGKNNLEENKELSMEVEETYGPKIPENINQKQNTTTEIIKINSDDDDSTSDSWVDVNEVKSKKKKKKTKHKKHKSKEKHKKSKHKKKDK